MTPAQQMLSEEFADDFHANTSERQERLHRLAQQSPKNRIAAMTQRINDPSKCEYCGSRKIWTGGPLDQKLRPFQRPRVIDIIW